MRNAALCLLILASLAIPSASVGEPVQWPGNSHWYEAVYVSIGISWEDARVTAENVGGYLTTIASEEENVFVFSLVSDEQYWYLGAPGFEYSFGPWLGGYQYDNLAEPDGHWRWRTEEPWSYVNWAPGEPNNDGGLEDRLHYFTNENPGVLTPGPTWNDAPDTNWEKGFIIEWPDDPYPISDISWGAIKVFYCR